MHELVADLLQLVVVGAHHHVGSLGDACLEQRALVQQAALYILCCWKSYNFCEETTMRRRSTLGLAFLLAVSSVIISAGPALAVGDITGTVMAPIPGICVEAYDSGSERDIAGFDITDADGTYTISVPDGSYKLFFYDSAACGERVEASTPGVTAKWHGGDANTFAAATVVRIVDGTTTPPVNITLTGLVTGTVTSGLVGGQVIPGICVEAYASTTELNIIGSDITAADGTYTIGSIAKDYKGPNYKLFFYDSDACGERVEASSPEVTARWYADPNGADNFLVRSPSPLTSPKWPTSS